MWWVIYHGHNFKTAPKKDIFGKSSPTSHCAFPAFALIWAGGWEAQRSRRDRGKVVLSTWKIAMWTYMEFCISREEASPWKPRFFLQWVQPGVPIDSVRPSCQAWCQPLPLQRRVAESPAQGLRALIFLPPELVSSVQGHEEDIRICRLTYHLL